jgi:phage terminase large subunit-like protein
MMTTKKQQQTNELIEHWRSIGPVEWAEGAHGWIGIDRQPIILTPWQRAVLWAWWENRDRVSTLAISNVKKTGKTFLNAVLLAWRWLALPGDHFAVGNDFDQSASRQFQEISEMVRRNEYLRSNVRATTRQLVFEPTGSAVTALAVDAAGNAGANHLTASHTEAWGIVYEGGIRAYEELTPPPGVLYGLSALRICDSYAGYETESDVWHRLVDRGLLGARVCEEWPLFITNGLLLFHMNGLEAQERCFRGTPTQAAIYYDEQRASLRPGTFSRLHENKRATGSEAFIPLEDWDRCIDPNCRAMLSSYERRLFVGVDASTKGDSSAVVAVYRDSELSKVVLAKHRIWQPSSRDPLDLDGTIGDFLRDLARSFSLTDIRYDPYQMHDLSTRLRSEGLPMTEYPQSVPNLTSMGQNLYELVKGGNLVLYPDEFMRTCASHAVALQSSRGWRIAKEKTSFKIDVIVALAMASLAAIEKGNVWYIA